MEIADEELPDLTGKVVLLYLSGAPQELGSGVALEACRYVRHHGRLFVVGQTAKIEGEEWISGVEGGVAWDSVITYVLFPSLSELNNRIKRHDETQTGCLPDLAMKSLAERIPGKTKASAADRKKGMA